MHLTLSVLLIMTLFIAKGLSGSEEAELMEITLMHCNSRGGTLVHNQCLCKAGYTGNKCDVSLFDVEVEDAVSDDNHKNKQFTNIHDNGYERTGIEPLSLSFNRLKRQADEGSGEGSGRSPTTSEEPETTEFSGSSAPTVVTTKPQDGCLKGQLFSLQTQSCEYPITFAIHIAVNETFLAEYSDINSLVARNFTARFVAEMEQSMANTSFISFVVISMANGSVIVNGEMNFQESSKLTTVEANLLLQRRLAGNEKIITIVAGDKNSCAEDDICGSNATCINTEGSFICSCSPGFFEVGTSNNTSNSDRRKSCQSQCAAVECFNDGVCIVGINGETFCSCTDQFGGVQCEKAVFRWLQAAIAVGVVLAVLLLLVIFLVIIFILRQKNAKQESTVLPLVTGFRSTTEKTLQEYPNQYAFEEEDESTKSFTPTHQAHPDNGGLTSTTSTFKPGDVQDDKL